MKRILALIICSLFIPHAAWAADAPELLKVGDYKCKVSKEYKLRECEVTKEGDKIVLNFSGKHLLRFKGTVYPADFIGKDKRVFVEAKLQEDMPFMCNTAVPQATQECKEQTVMIELKKKGKRWVGKVPVKYYWDKWVGEGENRKKDGYQITVETLMVELRPTKAKPKTTTKPKTSKTKSESKAKPAPETKTKKK